jgi:RHS repeat-associated protein
LSQKTHPKCGEVAKKHISYYSFGSLVPNRHGSSTSYRYGFQGQEKDDEIKGEGNSLNYEYRMHDPRVGRFFSRDPLELEYPWYSPYSFGGNKVIRFVELEGLEEKNPSLFTKAMNILGSQFHLNRLNAYITKNNIPDENVIALKNDTFVVVRIMENSEAKFSIFRLSKKNDDIMPILLTSSENDDIDLSLKQFNKTELLGNLTLPAPGFGAAGKVANGLRLASSADEVTKVGVLAKMATLLNGSGPVAGVLEVSSRVKSLAQFKKYNPKNAIEFIFDPKTETFLVGKVKQLLPGLSPHQKLAKVAGADSNVVGGMFMKGAKGEIITNEASGHFYKNWTPAIRSQFEKFMQSQTGQAIQHIDGPTF